MIYLLNIHDFWHFFGEVPLPLYSIFILEFRVLSCFPPTALPFGNLTWLLKLNMAIEFGDLPMKHGDFRSEGLPVLAFPRPGNTTWTAVAVGWPGFSFPLAQRLGRVTWQRWRERERDIGTIIWYSNDIWYKILEYHHQAVLL